MANVLIHEAYNFCIYLVIYAVSKTHNLLNCLFSMFAGSLSTYLEYGLDMFSEKKNSDCLHFTYV